MGARPQRSLCRSLRWHDRPTTANARATAQRHQQHRGQQDRQQRRQQQRQDHQSTERQCPDLGPQCQASQRDGDVVARGSSSQGTQSRGQPRDPRRPAQCVSARPREAGHHAVQHHRPAAPHDRRQAGGQGTQGTDGRTDSYSAGSAQRHSPGADCQDANASADPRGTTQRQGRCAASAWHATRNRSGQQRSTTRHSSDHAGSHGSPRHSTW